MDTSTPAEEQQVGEGNDLEDGPESDVTPVEHDVELPEAEGGRNFKFKVTEGIKTLIFVMNFDSCKDRAQILEVVR